MDLIILKNLLEGLAETPEDRKSETRLMLAGSSSSDVNHKVQSNLLNVRVVDCDGDTISGVVTWVKTDHYETCLFYAGAQMSVLHNEGTAITHALADDPS